jgi:hypothetical protein
MAATQDCCSSIDSPPRRLLFGGIRERSRSRARAKRDMTVPIGTLRDVRPAPHVQTSTSPLVVVPSTGLPHCVGPRILRCTPALTYKTRVQADLFPQPPRYCPYRLTAFRGAGAVLQATARPSGLGKGRGGTSLDIGSRRETSSFGASAKGAQRCSTFVKLHESAFGVLAFERGAI